MQKLVACKINLSCLTVLLQHYLGPPGFLSCWSFIGIVFRHSDLFRRTIWYSNYIPTIWCSDWCCWMENRLLLLWCCFCHLVIGFFNGWIWFTCCISWEKLFWHQWGWEKVYWERSWSFQRTEKWGTKGVGLQLIFKFYTYIKVLPPHSLHEERKKNFSMG